MPRKKVDTTATAPAVHPRHSGTPAFIGAILIMGTIIVGGAILIGKSDSGEIDVTAAIQEANMKSVDAEGNLTNQVNNTRNDLRDLPNGGLVPQGEQPQTPPPEQKVDDASTTASTTEDGTDTDTSTNTPEDETGDGTADAPAESASVE